VFLLVSNKSNSIFKTLKIILYKSRTWSLGLFNNYFSTTLVKQYWTAGYGREQLWKKVTNKNRRSYPSICL